MGDEGRAQASVQNGKFVGHLDAQLGVQVGQRLVHQKSSQLAHHGARQRGTLALPARQLPRLVLQQLAQAERAGQLDHFRVDAPAVNVGVDVRTVQQNKPFKAPKAPKAPKALILSNI